MKEKYCPECETLLFVDTFSNFMCVDDNCLFRGIKRYKLDKVNRKGVKR